MKIESVRAYRLSIPFRFAFTHSRASRKKSDNIIVALELDCGITGYGEGVPREYVTGETVRGAFDALKDVDFSKINDEISSSPDPPSALIEIASGLEVNGNAARCALEIALLDTAGRLNGESLSSIIRRLFNRPPRGRIPRWYSAVMSLGASRRAALTALMFRLLGFRDLKVKIGPDVLRENARIRTVRRWFGSGRIRLDANGCLDKGAFLQILEAMKKNNVWAIEDPLDERDLPELADIIKGIHVPVILDEPFRSREEALNFLQKDSSFIMNIRISKCGGVLPSSEIASDIIARGRAFGLGCQVGESAILSAAGRHFVEAFPEAVFLEGSYDRYILSGNIIEGGVGFGYGGRWKSLGESGLGIDVNPSKLAKLSEGPLELWKRE